MKKELKIGWRYYFELLQMLTEDLFLLQHDELTRQEGTWPAAKTIKNLRGNLLFNSSLEKNLFGPNCQTVYGAPRGGLIPAVFVSHKLKLELKMSLSEPETETVFIDDILDSGRTVRSLWSKGLNPSSLSAFLFYRSGTPKLPGPVYYTVRIDDPTTRIVFPYEMEDEH